MATQRNNYRDHQEKSQEYDDKILYAAENEEEEKKDTDEVKEDQIEIESVEKIFEGVEVPSWQNQLTMRAFVASLILAVLFTFIVTKLNLTTGIIPSLNVSAGLLGFFFVKTWTKFLEKSGLLKQPFTRQENTVIQTCVVASSGIAFSGGFSSYLFAMSETVAKQSSQANTPADIKNPSLAWMIGFIFVVSFLGLFSVVPLRKVFIAIAMILGDGVYNFFKVLGRTLYALSLQFFKKDSGTVLPVGNKPSSEDSLSLSYDDQRRIQLFLKDQIPAWFAIAGYLTVAVISLIVVPLIFRQLKWYYIVVIYVIAPVLAFCNAYGCGLTDWSLASTYGKLAIFTIGTWAGSAHGGVIAGLAACGVMMNIVSTASDLMQDFKTGYLTLASPSAMFVSQFIGTAMGCVISPCVFWLFYKAFDNFGVPGSQYPAPFALVYRNMSILGVEGFSALPKHCLTLCYVFFFGAIVINAIRDLVGKKKARFIPLPMAMAIPFYLGGYFAIDMCVGSLILFVWRKVNKAQADAFGSAVASGLICGDGIWSLPSSVLALAGVQPPICMKFLTSKTNAKVDAFLSS
ncbi:unnamed protein product [Dovyalis caffra]|uniref:Metal-nicotianamine transporter YSL7 n=1 Tax=Dovyalis caffra TaxID=77055 RepID=A0AAV1RKT2_9ROSI|nr:unnamed protein product [Dovyalis caffra]